MLYAETEYVKEGDILTNLIACMCCFGHQIAPFTNASQKEFQYACFVHPTDLIPSIIAKLSQYFAIQGNKNKRIYNNCYNITRLRDTNRPPIQLFNLAFT